MKRLVLCLVVFACGGSTPGGGDAGVDGSSSSDGSASDAANGSDVSSTPDGGDAAVVVPDGGAGSDCDPKNAQCASGLLCCPLPAQVDGGITYACEKPVNKGCPMFP